jgi:tetratricopeptide (TPR) repeat protein
MRRGAQLAALGGLLAVSLVIVSPTWAQSNSTSRAQKHYLKGEKLFSLGQFDDALKQYQAAYDAEPFPEFLFNMAQCHRNLGDYEQAVDQYREYLDKKPNAENRQQVEATIGKLEREIARQRARDPRLTEDPNGENNGDPIDDDDDRPPFYTRWPFWVGVAVVGIAGGATGAYFLTRESAPTTDLGNLDF